MPDYRFGWFNELLCAKLDQFLTDVLAQRSSDGLRAASSREKARSSAAGSVRMRSGAILRRMSSLKLSQPSSKQLRAWDLLRETPVLRYGAESVRLREISAHIKERARALALTVPLAENRLAACLACQWVIFAPLPLMAKQMSAAIRRAQHPLRGHELVADRRH